MKIVTRVLTLLLLIVGSAHAQTFRAFKVILYGGYAVPFRETAKGGVSTSIEPQYAINDQVTLGLRFESASTSRGEEVMDNEKFSTSVWAFTADHSFGTKSLRPFLGFAAGWSQIERADEYITKASGLSYIDYKLVTDHKFGYGPRLGVETSRIRFSAECTFTGNSEKMTLSNTGGGSNSFLGIKAGYVFGGRRKTSL